MENHIISDYQLDHIEIYAPMAKALAFWHQKALGFSLRAKYKGADENKASYVLDSNGIRIIITAAYPSENASLNNDITAYTNKHYCGVKRIALKVSDVKGAYQHAVENGAIPLKAPHALEDSFGKVEQASIKLYEDNEIVFLNREGYNGVFLPGYVRETGSTVEESLFVQVDHVAAELRTNQIGFWTNYLSKAIGTELIQSIESSSENTTGMLLNISQSPDKQLTMVMAEPDPGKEKTKIQHNIDKFGAGIHHVAFSTTDMVDTLEKLQQNHVEFVNFPPAYYQILRENEDMDGLDIDTLERYGILVDKEGDSYLLQKFIAPITERPYFFYEIVQRVKGYNGFALKNINVLKKAEERQIIESEA